MNGQIQYGSARPLTSEPTPPSRRAPRLADPARFESSRSGLTRPVALLFGASLLLGGLLTAMPREIPGIAVATVLGGAWLSLVLAMTLPTQSERAGQELVRRLAQFRHELNAIGDTPTRAMLERMILRASELGLRADEVGDELQQLRACVEALDMQSRLERGDLPVADSLDPLPPGDTCHFICPVRFGRRRSDQFGHLLLTSGWLKFRGALDVSVSWAEVASLRRDGRDLVVSLHDSRRMFRFSCHSFGEAATGGVIAEHLAQAARVEDPAGTPSPSLHASV